MDLDARLHKQAELRALLEPTVERLGFELTAVELASERILRVSIDGPDGVGIGDCARVSRAISPILDVEDPIDDAYRLEVSSPGIDRPIQRPEDFVRFAGLRVRVRTGTGKDRKKYKGWLVGLVDDAVVLRHLKEPDRTWTLPLYEVDQVRLDLDHDEYARLGAGLPVLEGETS